jgi:hypothetical protein
MAKGAQSLSNSGNVHLLYIRHDFELVKSLRADVKNVLPVILTDSMTILGTNTPSRRLER